MDFFSSKWDDKSVSSLQAVLTLAALQALIREVLSGSAVFAYVSELQISEGIEDNSKIIFLISQRKHML